MVNFNLVKILRGGMNPQQLLNSMLPQVKTNPAIANAIKLAQQGDTKGVENIARNMCKSQGVDFDTEFKRFMDSMH